MAATRCGRIAVAAVVAVTFTIGLVIYLSPSLTRLSWIPSSSTQFLRRENHLSREPHVGSTELPIRSTCDGCNAAENRSTDRKTGGCAGVDTRAIITWKRGLVTELRPTITKSCEKLALNVPQAKARVSLALKTWKAEESIETFRRKMRNCSVVRQEFSARNSVEEENFPIAYVLVFHNNTQQLLRLLKVLWRPQNLFCLHPDAKQNEEFVQFFRDFASCLDNVFITSKLERVIYAHHTIMDAQLNCMKDLLAFHEKRWKYILTLCGLSYH